MLLPYGEDPLRHLAQRLIAANETHLPDLRHCIILMPSLEAAPRLRRELLAQARIHGHSALLGPRITTLPLWTDDFQPTPRATLGEHARELMLLEALQHRPGICGGHNPWVLTTSLISLFDEITRYEAVIPEDSEPFSRRIARAYGLDADTVSAQSAEARLVHRLWQAWRQQHHQEDAEDCQQRYLDRLTSSQESLPPHCHFYLLGYDSLLPAEARWARALLRQGQANFLIQGVRHSRVGVDDYHPAAVPAQLIAQLGAPPPGGESAPDDNEYTAFLDQVYAPQHEAETVPAEAHKQPSLNSLKQRAQQFAAAFPASPAARRLTVFRARDAEEEARAVDLQTRRWLLAGKQSIAIITEDRRLARRIRALLERAGVCLQDNVGWALSTTSAATAVERLLQIVEEDFAHIPLLDLLKSPFIFPDREREARLKQVFRLEHDIILQENIARGLERYRQHIVYRQHRLGWSTDTLEALMVLLDRLGAACKPLLPFVSGDRHAPAAILDALSGALQTLGMQDCLAVDAAGEKVLAELLRLRQATSRRQLRFTWSEFRTWLGRALESATFTPLRQDSQVQLFTLEQSRLQTFDALILAGADEEHLPGRPVDNPFFNDAVRAEFGLPLARQWHSRHFYHYRRLLEAADQLLISYHGGQNGEEIQPSPWLALLTAFHHLAYRHELNDPALTALTRRPDTQVIHSDPATQPTALFRPAPAAPGNLLPHRYSATRYQQLMDCPYQFFAATCLGLKAPERIREALEKSDYGERVHRILQRFHEPGRHASLDPPVTATQRREAIHRLEQLSRQEFHHDLEDNILHRGWLQRWQACIPAYIDWQIERAREWRVAAVEERAENVLGTLQLHGRLDRIDCNDSGLAILDYKTGALPTQAMVDQGEAVQLPFYALLKENPVAQAAYLGLGKDEVKTGARVEGEQLATLSAGIGQRLVDLAARMAAGAPLPAWGDETTCGYCPMSGICRRQAWTDHSEDQGTI